MAGSKGVVLAVLFANGAIAVLKFGGFLLTGSASMLSETYHSISDTGNQVFLLVGIRCSEKRSTREHPFGYGKAQFFYSFLVSVLLFGIAGWESVKHGSNATTRVQRDRRQRPRDRRDGVCSRCDGPVVVGQRDRAPRAIAFESYAFVKANAELRR